MRQLTGSTRIRIKRPRPPLTGDTRIRLDRIVGLSDWCGYLKDSKEWDEDKHPRGNPENAGEFTKVFCRNLKENRKDLQKTFDKANLPEEEKEVIADYTGGESDEINEYQRDKSAPQNPAIEAKVELLDRALQRTTLEKNIKVYRTVNARKEDLEKILNIEGIGDVPDSEMDEFLKEYFKTNEAKAHDEAFLSTTLNKSYKHKKRRGKQKEYLYSLQYTINAPKEAHGLYVESITKYPGQDEVLILRENDLDLYHIKFNSKSKTFFINSDLIIEGEEK